MKKYLISDFRERLFEMLKEIDIELEDANKHISAGCYSSYSSDLFHVRIAVAEAYNKSVDFNSDRINPFAYQIEPLDAVHLSDTITCPECKGEKHEQTCWCFGRGYITINMMTEQAIRKYILSKDKQDKYIELINKKSKVVSV